ncbi:MAG: hypothetical protein ABF296_06245 [Oceanococcaceae bacterium]
MRTDFPTAAVLLVAASVLLACSGGRDETATPPRSETPTTETGRTTALLGSSRGGHVWADFCATHPDTAALPTDPRTLITEGANAGRNVVFNVGWQDCFLNDPLRPQTCGDYRALYRIGERVGRGQGEPGTAHMFSGDNPRGINFLDPSTYSGERSFWTLTAAQYNNVWRTWSGYNGALTGRPDDFDTLVAERYGSALPAERNPYPLPGEDPNITDGGSGQLPLALTQLRDEDGRWTGTLGVKLCSFCHDGQLTHGGETRAVYGGMGTIGDFHTAFRDFAAVGALPFGLLSGAPVTVASNRGTGAIDQFQVGFIAFNGGTVEELTNPRIVFSQAIGNIKSPPWWNMGSRPQKFHGAVLPMDSSRIDMAAYYPMFGSDPDPVGWVDEVSYPFQVWAESLKAPVYPGEINTALAQAGSILFHSKNLWADGDNPVPEPANPGNGSCASCHGAYAPRFVNDPAFLADPRMAGIAANIQPLDIMRTDPAYAEGMQSLREPDGSINNGIRNVSFIACDIGAAGYTPDKTPVMLAPPLHGIWASAPYFHNASVPNIWGVLDPARERPTIWKRVSAPAPAALEGRVVMGFDTDFERAYDTDKLGWKYDELDCLADAAQTAPLLTCSPAPIPLLAPEGQSPLQGLLDGLYVNLALTWNLSVDEAHLIPFTDAQIDNRKVYNTHIYSQGNQGHDFTAVLSDAERRALIEYLKTL